MVTTQAHKPKDRNLLLLLFQKASDDKMVESLTAAVHVVEWGREMGRFELCTGSGWLKCAYRCLLFVLKLKL